MAKSSAITLVFHLNLLVFRYVVLEFNDKLTEGIVFQLPWWGFETAFKQGYFLKLT